MRTLILLVDAPNSGREIVAIVGSAFSIRAAFDCHEAIRVLGMVRPSAVIIGTSIEIEDAKKLATDIKSVSRINMILIRHNNKGVTAEIAEKFNSVLLRERAGWMEELRAEVEPQAGKAASN
jgi:hypothetical protein